MTAMVEPPALSSEFKGTVVLPAHLEYDQARAIYNRGIDRRPAMIVRPTGAADVIDAVNLARSNALPLAVKCGGHSVAGTSVCDDGVLIDLSSLKGVHVDSARGTARAGGGTLWGEYDRETQMFGLATPGGRVTTTGVGGFCLGGGYGWLSGVHGLTCDNLVSADLVTADGRLIEVTEDSHPELMWGLRGGGGNFGVVTSFEFRVHPVGPILLAGMLVVPNDERAREVARGYRDYVEQAPETVASALATLLAPPADFVPPELHGKPVMGILVAYVGDPDEGVEVLRPLRDLVAGVGMDLVQPMPYTAFQAIVDPFAPKGWLNYHRGQHLSALTDAVIDDYLDVGRTIGSPMTQGIIFRNGGAISRVAEDATAASNRGAPYMGHPIACWQDPAQTADEMAWVQRFSEALTPVTTGGVYLNFEPGTAASDVRSGYGAAKQQRLVQLKDAWDPDNLFRFNHNIAPSKAAAGQAATGQAEPDEPVPA